MSVVEGFPGLLIPSPFCLPLERAEKTLAAKPSDKELLVLAIGWGWCAQKHLVPRGDRWGPQDKPQPPSFSTRRNALSISRPSLGYKLSSSQPSPNALRRTGMCLLAATLSCLFHENCFHSFARCFFKDSWVPGTTWAPDHTAP